MQLFAPSEKWCLTPIFFWREAACGGLAHRPYFVVPFVRQLSA